MGYGGSQNSTEWKAISNKYVHLLPINYGANIYFIKLCNSIIMEALEFYWHKQRFLNWQFGFTDPLHDDFSAQYIFKRNIFFHQNSEGTVKKFRRIW